MDFLLDDEGEEEHMLFSEWRTSKWWDPNSKRRYWDSDEEDGMNTSSSEHDPLSWDSTYSNVSDFEDESDVEDLESEESDNDDIDEVESEDESDEAEEEIDMEEVEDLMENMVIDERSDDDSVHRAFLVEQAEKIIAQLEPITTEQTDMQRFKLTTTVSNKHNESSTILLHNESHATPFFPAQNYGSFAVAYSKVGVSEGVHSWRMRVVSSPDRFPTIFYGIAGTWNSNSPESDRLPGEQSILISTLDEKWLTFLNTKRKSYLDTYCSTQLEVNQIVQITVDADSRHFSVFIDGQKLCKPITVPDVLTHPLHFCVFMVHEGTVVQLV